MKVIEGFKTIQERNSTESIKNGYAVYSADVVDNKYPHLIDGLKTIHRRTMWYCRNVQKLEDMVSVIAGVFKMHTAGDGTIYDTIVRLAQPFKLEQPLISGQGNVGKYYGGGMNAAAPRYLKGCISQFAYDVFFKGINPMSIPMRDNKVLSDDEKEKEPKYLIPKIPMSLLLGNSSIGIGFKATLPMIPLTSVCDLVIKYADDQLHGYKEPGYADPKIYGRYMIPAYPIPNLITNRQELLREYAQGNFEAPIQIDGQVELSGEAIVVHYVVYGERFDNRSNKLREMLKDSKCYLYQWIKTANALSAKDSDLTIPLVRGKNPFEALDKLRPVLALCDTIHPKWRYMTDNQLVEVAPTELLTYWYQARYTAISVSLKHDLAKLIEEERRLRAVLMYLDNDEKMTKIVKQAANLDDIIDSIYREFKGLKISRSQAEAISNVKIQLLARDGRPGIITQLERNHQEQQEIMEKNKNIDQLILSEAARIKKAYGKPTKTRYSDEFKGYVQFGDLGIIHFFDEEDMCKILNTKGWGSIVKTIHLYDSKSMERFIVRGGQLRPMTRVSREITCEGVVVYPKDRNYYTMAINEEGNTSVVESDLRGIYKGYNLFPITKTFYAIHRNGRVTKEDYTNYTIRKNISKGAKTDIIHALPGNSEDVVVFHMNDSDPNILRIDRILRQGDGDLGRVVTVPSGKTHVLGVFPVSTKEIYLNIPDECTKNIVVNHLVVKQIQALFKRTASDTNWLDLNKSSALSKKLKRSTVVKYLYHLDLGE